MTTGTFYTADWTTGAVCSCYTNAPTTIFSVNDFGGMYIYDDPATISGIRIASVSLTGLTSLTSATLDLDCAPNTYGTTAGTFRTRCEAAAAPVAYTTTNNQYHRTQRTTYVSTTVTTNQASISIDVKTLLQDLIDTYGANNITAVSFAFAALYWGLSAAYVCLVNNGTDLKPKLTIVYETSSAQLLATSAKCMRFVR